MGEEEHFNGLDKTLLSNANLSLIIKQVYIFQYKYVYTWIGYIHISKNIRAKKKYSLRNDLTQMLPI